MDYVQILGLRDVQDTNGNVKKSDRKFHRYKWGDIDVPTLFRNIDKHIEKIPEDERWNMYFTVSQCKDAKAPRWFSRQSIIPIDIDDIDVDKAAEYGPKIFGTLGLEYKKIGALFSGNGVQFFIQVPIEWDRNEHFDQYRIFYKAFCGRIAQIMYDNGLIGNVDTSVWSSARLMRLPNTENRKPKKPTRTARILQGNIEPVPFDLVTFSELPVLDEEDQIHPKAAIRLPKPDTEAVQSECEFIKYAKKNQDKVSEPQWYAMLSIVGRLADGENLIHEYSKGHPKYSPSDTERKGEQAVEAAGPRTCQNIETLWDGCKECPHYRKVKSPILLKGENHISTIDTGFWNTVLTKGGEIKHTTPNYDDLFLHYNNLHPHITVKQTGFVHQWTGKYWKLQEMAEIHSFVEESMNPKPNRNHCTEFEAKLKRTNLRDETFLGVQGKVNCNNGIVDVINDGFTPHSQDYGFPYVLPYDYDEQARCPNWIKFIKEVTLDRQELIDILQEYMGYTLAYEDARLGQKALILIGDGSNGKSVFLEVFRNLLGEENHSAVNLQEAMNSNEARNAMNSKMANITEELPRKALMESSMFKDMCTGGVVPVRKLYHGTFQMRMRAKLIMACNEAPYINDASMGTRRRLLTLPFDYRVDDKNRDPFIIQKLSKELPAIFNWAMEGYRRLYENKYQFSEGGIAKSTADKVRIDSSFVKDFLEDCCEIGEECYAPTNDLYDEWRMHSPRKFSNNITKTMFSRELLSVLRTYSNVELNTFTKRIDGEVIRCYPWVSLKESNDSTY